MRTRSRAVTASVVALLLTAGAAPADSGSRVGIRVFQFRPGQLEIEAGTRVTWTNEDDIAHTVTSGTPDARDRRFERRLDGAGAATTIEFTESGVYPYFCDRHRSMRGEIRVK